MALVSQLMLFLPLEIAQRVGYSQENNITALGNASQANAYQLKANVNRVSTSTAGNNSVKLPSFVDDKLGMHMLTNNGASNVNLYPSLGENINPLAANIGIVMTPNQTIFLWRLSSTTFIYILV